MLEIADPIIFEPLPMERVWGGRRIESLHGRHLPQGVPIGESWELVDREDAQSVVHGGEFAGLTLNELWRCHRARVFGHHAANLSCDRFPLLIKILDARERLSVQVHPPARLASALGGDPKTEMWYLLDAAPGAAVYAGLHSGTTRSEFERALHTGGVEATLHRISVHTGDSIFIPSGRVHAIAEGCLIVEVQQNSDTTYRVFDWNRVGLDGVPRALHIEASLASIDFEDFEPSLSPRGPGVIAECPHFRVEEIIFSGDLPGVEPGDFSFVSVVDGAVRCGSHEFRRGQMFLMPSALADPVIEATTADARILRSTLPMPA